MTRVKFIFKLLIAMLSPALLAFALVKVWSSLYPNPSTICNETGGCYTVLSEVDSLSEQFFGFLILGLLLLSFVLPILITFRDIQNERSAGGSLTTIQPLTDKLWK